MTEGERIATSLREAVAEGARLLDGVREEQAARRPAEGQWCAREVVGHLIDSACNNHRRFIINQDAERLLVDPYAQHDWVDRQRYADRPMTELLRLWVAYNAHLERVIRAMPEDVLIHARGPIGSHAFPYAAVRPSTEYATLAYLADDYVGHIKHHLNQIPALLSLR